MCLSTLLKVIHLEKDLAIMSDGRKVKLGPLTAEVGIGDYLEVYADIALLKVSNEDVKEVQTLRKQVS